PEEDRPAFDLRTSTGQVGDERLAHVDGQRKTVPARALATDDEFAVVPVDVLELEPGHLTGPKAEPHQHREDGEVPPARERGGVRCAPRRGAAPGRKSAGPPPPAQRRCAGNRSTQGMRRVSLPGKDPQRAAKPGNEPLRRADVSMTAPPHDEGTDIPRREHPE